ncbi:putative acylphosphatase [Paratrimastix pyriformis]|uniref:acylphosphatase n=1 Tax=Paratrimastix pyriformis TaxID=342808 RepID=A0ABQ8UNV6_9EUKA|nr:putative acylphosphatase [Paratrimastix pyriformis]
MATGLVRARVIWHGEVQGVNFRYHTREDSDRFRVSGFVQNLPDSTVLTVAEGEKTEVEHFIQAIEGTMGSRTEITGKDVVWEPATGEFRSFEIRR